MPHTARIVVLAQSLQHFHAWCRQTGHSPRDRRILYAAGPNALRGLTGATVVRYGNWRDRIDGHALEAAIAALEAPAPAAAAA